MPDDADVYSMTPDEARTRLVRDGANMLPALKEALARRAGGADKPPDTPPRTLSPFGSQIAMPLTPEQAIKLDPDGLTVDMVFPRPVKLQMPGGDKIQFGIGRQPVPRFLSNHPFLEANGVRLAP